jgi:hypothetical protein
MNVCQQYEAGYWVPSYYGNNFTVAKKTTGTLNDQDLTFRVSTLSEAVSECLRRNLTVLCAA